MDQKCLFRLVFFGTSLSILSRLGFGLVIWRNKSNNPISLSICVINIMSNCFWLPYSIQTHIKPLLFRSIADLLISIICLAYIACNIWKTTQNNRIVLPK